MDGQFVIFLSAKNSIFRVANYGDTTKKIIGDLQNAISTVELEKIEPIFVLSSNDTTFENDAKLFQEWLGRKSNLDLIHIPETQEEPSFLFTTTILSKVRAHPLVVCIYHNDLWEIFLEFFPYAKKPTNNEVLLTNLSAMTEEEKILYHSS